MCGSVVSGANGRCAGSSAIEGVMADVAAGDHVNHILGEVGSVVGDAFQVLCHQDKVKGGENERGVFHHVGEELPEDLVAQLVHLVVAGQDSFGQLAVFAL